jgi:hypothetical protein
MRPETPAEVRRRSRDDVLAWFQARVAEYLRAALQERHTENQRELQAKQIRRLLEQSYPGHRVEVDHEENGLCRARVYAPVDLVTVTVSLIEDTKEPGQ